MHMKVLIIEDELPAAEKLERYLLRYNQKIEILKKLESIKQSVSWLTENQEKVDLIFLDIQLTDGLSFNIFDQVEIKKPVIFTTAFNQYAVEAFKHNSIDYLLKPITFDDLSGAMQKLESMRDSLREADSHSNLENLSKALNQIQDKKSYKTRFMVKLGEHIRSITADQIPLFYAEGRNVFILTEHGGKFIIDYKLEELENLLSPQEFFRVNRTFIINIKSISDVLVYSNSRLKISIDQDYDKEIIVSREKVSQFKTWFDGQTE